MRTFEDFTFHFPQDPGLYLVTGVNEERPELGSNGVGKSTLFDALPFVFFGKSARGLAGGELLRDGEAAMSVRLETDNDAFARVWFTNKKAQVLFNGEAVSDVEIQKRLGLDRDMFLTATVIPQKMPLFAEYQPTIQVNLLQRLLGLERWNDYATRAGNRVAPLESAVSKLTGQVLGYEDNANSWDIGRLEQDCTMWEALRENRIADATAHLEEKRQAAQPVAGYEQWKTNLASAETSAARAGRAVQTLTTRDLTLRDRVAACVTAVELFTQAMDSLRKDYAIFGTGAPTCPTCKQDITVEHKVACGKVLAEKMAEKRTGYETAIKNLALAKKERDDNSATLTTTQIRWRTLSATVVTLQSNIRVEEQRQRIAGAAIQDAMAAEDDIKDEVNPFLASVARAKAAQEAAVAKAAEVDKERVEKSLQLERVQLWQKSFKTIRSQMISDALTQFTLEIAAVSEDLGLVGWETKPMIDPAVFESARNASGFKFVVKDPYGVERHIDAYSGGELQRVHLAIQAGLGGLVASTHGVALDFEVWDEPSSYLSQEGVVGLFAALRTRAERLQRPIFVIDHHHMHAAEVTAVYSLIRRDGKTTLEA